MRRVKIVFDSLLVTAVTTEHSSDPALKKREKKLKNSSLFLSEKARLLKVFQPNFLI